MELGIPIRCRCHVFVGADGPVLTMGSGRSPWEALTAVNVSAVQVLVSFRRESATQVVEVQPSAVRGVGRDHCDARDELHIHLRHLPAVIRLPAMSCTRGNPAGHLPADRMSLDRVGRPVGPLQSNMSRSADWAGA